MKLDKSILVTGSSGLIGTAVCDVLQEEGIPFTASYFRNPTKYQNNIQIDLENEVPPNSGIDVIVHCASAMVTGNLGFEEAAAINARIDANILEYAQQNDSVIIYMSGTSLYGYHAPMNCKESSKLDASDNFYFAQKQRSEELFSQHQKTFILRVSAPYHPTMKARTVLKIFIERASLDQDIMFHGTGARTQDFTHSGDVARAVLSCLNNEKAVGIYNIASGQPISMKELAKEVVSQTPNCKSVILPSGQADPQEHYKASFDISKAANELMWEPKITVSEGIRQWINTKGS